MSMLIAEISVSPHFDFTRRSRTSLMSSYLGLPYVAYVNFSQSATRFLHPRSHQLWKELHNGQKTMEEVS